MLVKKILNSAKKYASKDLATYLRFASLRHQFSPGIRGHKPVDIRDIFRLYAQEHEEVFFVQVGSNDGQKNDPLHRMIHHNHWKGILIEVVPNIFSRLVDYYADLNLPGLIFENVGIAPESGQMNFYHLDEQEGDLDWYNQVGSFDKDTFIRNIEIIPGLEKRMQVSSISTITLTELLEKHKVQQFNLLHIDAEGYDAKILMTLDLARFQPDLILYESEWLSPDETKACEDLLHRYHYQLRSSSGDTLAIHSRIFRSA